MIELSQCSSVGLGTWVFGERDWQGETEPRPVIKRAVDAGLNVIDTAPSYGLGRAEERTGEILEELDCRNEVFLTTKCGLEWDKDGNIWRNSSADSIRNSVSKSLERLRVNRIDACFIHWPDEQTPLPESVETLEKLRDEGKIRHIGLANVTLEQLQTARKGGSIDVLQPPYNLFERTLEGEVREFCEKNDISLMTCSALCRGLLTGKFDEEPGDETQDIRGDDPKFTDRRGGYIRAVRKIEKYLREQDYEHPMAPLMIRWLIQQEQADTVLVGARNQKQLDENLACRDVSLSEEEANRIRDIADGSILAPVGTDFMAPPSREEVAKLL